MLRAKFVVSEKTEYAGGQSPVRVVLQAVTSGSPENESFFKWTPSGKIEMSVKPEVAAELKVGEPYYVDFTSAIDNEPPKP